ncbi:homoserine O-acetyltransferase MetX [Methanocella conradii]|uniref:homoserine O-acetyltransferase MetX n=1 Tax=Methanocella conradii TaxID=1175444 RepID=UPI0024B389A8|nr:homoserine O-acetyltransferase [Methanocella conradii]MDI6895841.1 homoserine O-acetyltransferase [Methanocella conradii]
MSAGSVGIVKTHYHHLSGGLPLESGQKLDEVTIAYETYGKLNKDKSNAILILHALSGDAHAAGWHEGDKRPGWWDIVIGPGKAFDTDKYFVICSNIIGGCKGSTGPSSINPSTGKPYGLNFPVITIGDMVNAQKRLIDFLGIEQLYAVAGGSMGGMQALQWCVAYPDSVRRGIIIATAAYSRPQHIAFNEVGRRAIMSDPNWNSGDYYGGEPPTKGLALARMVGHITYLSDESMQQKFGRRLKDKERYGYDFSTDFQVESYLQHQGDAFVKRFDANSYLYITKAIDYFDLKKNGSLDEAFRAVKARFLVISVTSDWLYPPYQSKEIVMALSSSGVDVSYAEINSIYGHDAFLLEGGQLNYLISNFLSPKLVKDVMASAVTIDENSSIEAAARAMLDSGVSHLPVVSNGGTISGIVTAWDISKAVALKYTCLDEIMTRNVVTIRKCDTLEAAAAKMELHDISALPVVDDAGHVIGILTSDGISKLIGQHK